MAKDPRDAPSALRHRSFLFVYFGLALAFILLGVSLRIAYHQEINSEPRGRSLPLPAASSAANTVELGLFIDNVYILEVEKKTYDADGWVWLTWSAELQQQLEATETTADQLLHFLNAVDDYDFALDSENEAPVRLPDGRHYQRFRFSGHFYVNDLDFRRFPFHRLEIPVVVELKQSQISDSGTALVLALDRTHSGIGANIDLGGYITRGFELLGHLHEYPSSLGDPRSSANALILPQARLNVRYEKSTFNAIMKYILPLVTIMALTLLSPSLSASGWDVRVGIPPTAMLTLIFLQQGYAERLPELHYLTYLDTVYNLCYLTNLILFGLFVWGTNEYSSASEAHKRAVTRLIDRMDTRFQIGLTLGITLLSLASWLQIHLHQG